MNRLLEMFSTKGAEKLNESFTLVLTVKDRLQKIALATVFVLGQMEVAREEVLGINDKLNQ